MNQKISSSANNWTINLQRSGFHSGPSPGDTIQPQKNFRQTCGRVSWIRQPLPGWQCWHHLPAGFARSGTGNTLQQSVQVSHERPGTTEVSAASLATSGTRTASNGTLQDVIVAGLPAAPPARSRLAKNAPLCIALHVGVRDAEVETGKAIGPGRQFPGAGAPANGGAPEVADRRTSPTGPRCLLSGAPRLPQWRGGCMSRQ